MPDNHGDIPRIPAAYVDSDRDRRPDALDKRLNHLVGMTAAGKQLGYGTEACYRGFQ